MSDKILTSREKRLLIFSTIIRLGHEAFKKDSFDAVIMHILNNSRSLMAYDRSSIVDYRSGTPKIIGLMGHSEVNQDSEYCTQLRKMLSGFRKLGEPVLLSDEIFQRYGVSQKHLDVFHDSFSAEKVLLLPMKSPEEKDGEFLIWVVEFLNETAPKTDNLLNFFTLLSTHYSEAIWYKLKTRGGRVRGVSIKGFFKFLFSPKLLFSVILILFMLALFYVQVPLQAVADFEFKPVNTTISYAPYSGSIDNVFFESGQDVKAANYVIQYDTKELMYDLSIAQKQLAETLAELDLAKTQSFNNVEYRGKIKILEIRRQLELNKIEKYKWFLERSKVAAKADGTLVIGDKNILTGKKVEAGDKLFEVVSEDNVFAEVYLNEKDAVVIDDNMKILLYPHKRPEQPIQAEIQSISPVPLKLGTNQFTYRIKVKPLDMVESYNCGMRGMANLSSKKVTLGYYLFRSLIIWWRKV